MTETVKLMITHIFRPPPSPQNCIFLIYGPIFIRFGINGPDINVKWLTQTKRKIPTQDGQFPRKTDNSHPRLTIPTQDGQFLPKTDNSHPIRTILTQDHWRNHRGGRGGPDPHNFQSVGVRPPQLLKSNIIIGYFDQKGRQAIPSLLRRDQNIKNKRLSDDIKQKTK